MPRIILTAQVENSAQWEDKFRTHGALLSSMGTSVTHFAANGDNEVVLYTEPPDLDRWLAVLKSPDTAAAMAMDGVKKETVKVFVLDKEFRYQTRSKVIVASKPPEFLVCFLADQEKRALRS